MEGTVGCKEVQDYFPEELYDPVEQGMMRHWKHTNRFMSRKLLAARGGWSAPGAGRKASRGAGMGAGPGRLSGLCRQGLADTPGRSQSRKPTGGEGRLGVCPGIGTTFHWADPGQREVKHQPPCVGGSGCGALELGCSPLTGGARVHCPLADCWHLQGRSPSSPGEVPEVMCPLLRFSKLTFLTLPLTERTDLTVSCLL